MKICLLGLDNFPVLAAGYESHTVAGEPVQQTLLAKALATRRHDVSMVVSDYGQPDGERWHGVTVYKAYPPDAGWPVVRFVHPRWTGVWSALEKADAEVYYTSCAGMQVGLLARFCARHGRRFVFRAASDADCDGRRLLIRYARDRWLYEYGLRRADAVLVQTQAQAQAMTENYGLAARVAGMLVQRPTRDAARDIDVLWVGNIRQLKRPDIAMEIARQLPHLRVHMVGGPLANEEKLYADVEHAAASIPNLRFHGPLSYRKANAMYDRARVLLNTSDVEGFPNTYLQAWVRGVPVVTLIDPDGIIAREGLGVAAASSADLGIALRQLLEGEARWQLASDRCRRFMEKEYGDDSVLAPYLETFAGLHAGGSLPGPADLALTVKAPHA